jgi:hypothetical protein
MIPSILTSVNLIPRWKRRAALLIYGDEADLNFPPEESEQVTAKASRAASSMLTRVCTYSNIDLACLI